jgi:hypothetical protein
LVWQITSQLRENEHIGNLMTFFFKHGTRSITLFAWPQSLFVAFVPSVVDRHLFDTDPDPNFHVNDRIRIGINMMPILLRILHQVLHILNNPIQVFWTAYNEKSIEYQLSPMPRIDIDSDRPNRIGLPWMPIRIWQDDADLTRSISGSTALFVPVCWERWSDAVSH